MVVYACSVGEVDVANMKMMNNYPPESSSPLLSQLLPLSRSQSEHGNLGAVYSTSLHRNITNTNNPPQEVHLDLVQDGGP